MREEKKSSVFLRAPDKIFECLHMFKGKISNPKKKKRQKAGYLVFRC